MPSAKRQRQRAGRQSRQQELLKHQQTRVKRRKIAAGAGVGVLALGAIYLVSQPRSAHKAAPKVSGAKKNSTGARPLPCPSPSGASARKTVFPAPPPTCIHSNKTYVATFHTDAGVFSVDLASHSSAKTVNDFVYLARYHFYDGTIFHRIIPGFVVQGGDPNPPTSATSAPTGPQGPGYNIAGEVPRAGSYHLGTVAMAKTGNDPAGTASSQFFIVTGSQGESLPPLYSVLGQVKTGIAVVNELAKAATASGIPSVRHKLLSVTISSS